MTSKTSLQTKITRLEKFILRGQTSYDSGETLLDKYSLSNFILSEVENGMSVSRTEYSYNLERNQHHDQ